MLFIITVYIILVVNLLLCLYLHLHHTCTAIGEKISLFPTHHCLVFGQGTPGKFLEYLMVKCRPYKLPQKFTLYIVQIPPHVTVKPTLDERYITKYTLETKNSKAWFIIAGEFNQTNLNSVPPKYYQHISCSTNSTRVEKL